MGRPRKNKTKTCPNCLRQHKSEAAYDTCYPCRKSEYVFKQEARAKLQIKRTLLNSKIDISYYAPDIRLLAWKKERGLLTPVEYYITASIYMDVVNSDSSYVMEEPKWQVHYMLSELTFLLEKKKDIKFNKKYI